MPFRISSTSTRSGAQLLAGHPVDPAQAEALRDAVAVLLAELQPCDMAA